MAVGEQRSRTYCDNLGEPPHRGVLKVHPNLHCHTHYSAPSCRISWGYSNLSVLSDRGIQELRHLPMWTGNSHHPRSSLCGYPTARAEASRPAQLLLLRPVQNTWTGKRRHQIPQRLEDVQRLAPGVHSFQRDSAINSHIDSRAEHHHCHCAQIALSVPAIPHQDGGEGKQHRENVPHPAHQHRYRHNVGKRSHLGDQIARVHTSLLGEV